MEDPIMSRRTLAALAVVLIGFSAACEGNSAPSGNGDNADSSRAAIPEGMQGTPGMDSGAAPDPADEVTRRMHEFETLDADSMIRALPGHRQVVANMIARMNRGMREMNMPADEAWTATVDSLRNDLIAMPDMSARELRDFIPFHHRRASKLIEMHRRMMQTMGM
jgi:hypothetical protein